MDRTRQIALGPALAGVAALVLLVSLFCDWYEPGFSAWTVFEVLDLLLAALALASMGMAAQALGVGLPRLRLPGGALLGVAGVALVIVVSQVIHHPPGAGDRGTEIGVWLALGAVVVLVVGAALGSSYVSVVRVGESQGSPPGGGPPVRPGTPPVGTPPVGTPPAGPPPAGTPLRGPGEEDVSTQPLPRSEPERPA